MAENSGASQLNFAEVLNIDSRDTSRNVLNKNGSKEREKSPAPFMRLLVDDDAVPVDSINIADQALYERKKILKKPTMINTDNINSPSVSNLLNEESVQFAGERKMGDSPTML